MNGPQDLGGQAGFGPVTPEKNEPIFHAEWEKRALALTLACGAMGHWSIDDGRFARESLHPADYYSSSYYEIWIKALESLLSKNGFVTAEEFRAGRSLDFGRMPKQVLRKEHVVPAMMRGSPYERDPGDAAPAFKPGDMVRTIVINPPTHTRLPRYARGKTGRVDAVQGFHVFPDAHASGKGEAPEHLYTVEFTASELWGRDGDPKQSVSIDAWESYLEPA